MALRARDPAARQDRLLGLRGLCSVSPDRLRREHRRRTTAIGRGPGGFRDHRRSVAVALELVGRPPSGGSEALIFRLKPEATQRLKPEATTRLIHFLAIELQFF